MSPIHARMPTSSSIYMDAKNPAPSQELHSREALTPVFAESCQINITPRQKPFVGQSSISSLTRKPCRKAGPAVSPTTSPSTAIACRLMIATLRYLDTFAKVDGA